LLLFNARMKPQANKTTVLPATLELGDENDQRFKLKFKKSNRKLDRKKGREEKKKQKTLHFGKKRFNHLENNAETLPIIKSEVASVKSSVSKTVEVAKVTPLSSVSKKTSIKSKDDKLTKQIEKLKETNPAVFEMLQSQNLVNGQHSAKDDVDYYEKKLKLKGTIGKKFIDDGLDFLLVLAAN
jgi:hypothetical protein